MPFYDNKELSSPDVSRATLLPLRSLGQTKNINNVLKTLSYLQRHDFVFGPRPSSVTRGGGQTSQRGRPHSKEIEVSSIRRSASHPKQKVNASSTPAISPSSRSPGRMQRKCALSVSEDGLLSTTERARYRNEVTRKLLDMYDEISELNECSNRMCQQLACAMRTDPRHAKEKAGIVHLASKPTDQQETALSGVVSALATLHEACVELVSAYLTPEEKRFLGVNTHVFQTREARASTYQYLSPSATAKKDPKRQSKRHPAAARGSGQLNDSHPSVAAAYGEVPRPSGAPVPPAREVRKTSSAVSHSLTASRPLRDGDDNETRSADSATDARPQQPNTPPLERDAKPSPPPAPSAFTTSLLPPAPLPEPVATVPDAAILPESTLEHAKGASGVKISQSSGGRTASETSISTHNEMPPAGSWAPTQPMEAPPSKKEPPPFKIINGKRLVLVGKVVPPASSDIPIHHVSPPAEPVEQKNTPAPDLKKIRPEFRHFLIDSDSDSSAPGSH